MGLYPVLVSGIIGYCSDLIMDPEGNAAYLLSVCGYQATVKGIIANFLENYGITLKVGDDDYQFERSSLNYKFQIKRLPSGLGHGIVYPELSLAKTEIENQFLIFTDMINETLDLFYRHLDKTLAMPLHPSWSRWLWDNFKNRDQWLTPLDTVIGNFKGYFVSFDPEILEDLISQAIRDKVPDIFECMEWKGPDNGKPSVT